MLPCWYCYEQFYSQTCTKWASIRAKYHYVAPWLTPKNTCVEAESGHWSFSQVSTSNRHDCTLKKERALVTPVTKPIHSYNYKSDVHNFFTDQFLPVLFCPIFAGPWDHFSFLELYKSAKHELTVHSLVLWDNMNMACMQLSINTLTVPFIIKKIIYFENILPGKGWHTVLCYIIRQNAAQLRLEIIPKL